ncbi:MAG TPA: diadenylate cyclase CdaA [Bacillota bacterium]|nr:diadenylate cyclase CdaA [Bacillota bacterium]
MAALLSIIADMGALDLLLAVVDVALVGFVLYRLLLLLRGSRAASLVRGVLLLVVATPVSGWLRLYTVHWLLEQFQLWLIFALLVVFQPELRRILEQLGRGRLLAPPPSSLGEPELRDLIGQVVRAVDSLSRSKTGAIIVIERETGLKEIIETGKRIDGLVSSEFLVNLFVPATPLHDGAAIIRGDRVVAAGCFLPLSDADNVSRDLGTRHRAALGITEQSDAVAAVVSEETGDVSLAYEGKLMRHLDLSSFEEMLTARLRAGPAVGLRIDRRLLRPGRG